VAELSEYEQQVLAQVRQRKEAKLARAPRRIVPEKVKVGAKSMAEGARRLPGAEKIIGGYQKTLSGLATASSKGGTATLSRVRMLKVYRRRGYPISDLSEIGDLPLEVVERQIRPRLFDVAYATAAAIEGAAAGVIITGGEALATVGSVAGAGAGAAPGLGTVTAVIAGDAAFTIAAGTRAAAHTAMYYGFDPFAPEEKVFLMSIINLGTATTAGAKYAAYRELSQLTQLLARRATWSVLNEHILPRVAAAFAKSLGARLTQRKLGQFVPIAGIAVGAGLNFKLLDDIAGEAYWVYRERFLARKRGAEAEGLWVPPFVREPFTGEPAEAEVGVPEVAASVLDALRTEAGIDVGRELEDTIQSDSDAALPATDTSHNSVPRADNDRAE
jgi:hypothetical protein